MSLKPKTRLNQTKPLNTNAQEFNFEFLLSSSDLPNQFLYNQDPQIQQNHYYDNNLERNDNTYNRRGNSNNSQSNYKQHYRNNNYNRISRNIQEINDNNYTNNNNIQQNVYDNTGNYNLNSKSQSQNSNINNQEQQLKQNTQKNILNNKLNSNYTDLEDEAEIETNDSNKGEDNNNNNNNNNHINQKSNIQQNNNNNDQELSDYYNENDKLGISDSFSENSNEQVPINKQQNTQQENNNQISKPQQFKLSKNYEFFYIQHQTVDNSEQENTNFSNPNKKEQILSLGEVNTLYDFFKIYNQLETPSKWQNIHKIALFQENHQPIWENYAKEGGCIIFKLQKNKYSEMLDELWETILFAIIGDQMKIDNQFIVNKIIGIQLNVQNKDIFLELWLEDSKYKYSTAMVLKKFLKVSDKQPFYYQSHSQSIQDNGIIQKKIEKLEYSVELNNFQTVERVSTKKLQQ